MIAIAAPASSQVEAAEGALDGADLGLAERPRLSSGLQQRARRWRAGGRRRVPAGDEVPIIRTPSLPGRTPVRSSPGLTSKYSVSISFTAGAAESAPKPPRSSVATTTISGSGYGASAAYHDWSSTRLAALGGSGLAGDVHGEAAEDAVGRAARLHAPPRAGRRGSPPRTAGRCRPRAAAPDRSPGSRGRSGPRPACRRAGGRRRRRWRPSA